MCEETGRRSREAVYQLIREAQEGDEGAREQLVVENGGLVRSMAMKFAGGTCEAEDLLQIGYIGLLKAIMRFDVSYGVMFSTYAVPMILGEIRRWLRDEGAVRMSRQLRQDILVMRRLQDDFCKEKGRMPRVSELAELMQVSGEELLRIMEASEAAGTGESLDDPDHFEQLEEGNYREEEERRLDLIRLKSVMGELQEKERQVITLRYYRDMTQQQVADRLGMSQVQVSRLEKKVLLGLRSRLG